MQIQNSIASINILNIINMHSANLSKHMRHLSSGLRIASVADDPSGWAIGQRMDIHIRALDQDTRNAQTSRSLLKVAEGSVGSTLDVLRNLKEKAIEAASDTATDADRRTIQKLFDQFADQIDDNALVTYNGMELLDGSLDTGAFETSQVLTNGSLSIDTTGATKLTDLARRTGDSLHIAESDTATISYVKDGTTYSTSFSVGSSTLEDLFKKANSVNGDVFDTALGETNEIGKDASGDTVYTANNEKAISVKTKDAGTDGSVAGLTISIQDKYGKIKKDVNSALDAFSESVQARDAKGDGTLYSATGPSANQGLKSGLSDMRSTALGIKGKNGHVLNVTTQKSANAAISVIDNAISRALDQQTTIGAQMMRLDMTIDNLTNTSENMTAAMSTILDADIAKEMVAYTKENILMQAAMAMLAQNNQNAGWYLSLLS